MIAAGLLAWYLIPRAPHISYGMDMHRENAIVPESMGYVTGIICLLACIWYQTHVYDMFVGVCLGMLDDIFVFRWRTKLLLHAIFLIPTVWHLWWWPIALLCTIFCSNSINILSGVNGVEVIQVIVMSMSFMCMDILDGRQDIFPGLITSTSIALFWFNCYPARIFVGDTFTTYGGCAIAWMTFTRRCYITTAVMMIPQGVNFMLSLPQLFGYKHCPRHRLPRWNQSLDMLETSGNGTLLNWILECVGPMHEARLTILVGLLQTFFASIALTLYPMGLEDIYLHSSGFPSMPR